MTLPSKSAALSGIPSNQERVSALIALTQSELNLIEQVGRRLQSELATALKSLNGDWRSSAYLHRTLGVDRTLCQRAINAVIAPGGQATFSRAPGVVGLRAITTGLRRAGAGDGAVCGVDAAIDQFQSLLKSLGSARRR